MKKLILGLFGLGIISASAVTFAQEYQPERPPYDRMDRYSVMSNRQGYAVCDDTRNGGRRDGRLIDCQDLGRGRNHRCDRVQNGCLAVEGPNNYGNALCQARCEAPAQNQQFRVAYYGEPLTRCDDRSHGGRNNSRVLQCVDLAHGNNHHCENQGIGCLAVEGPRNNGNAMCDAICD